MRPHYGFTLPASYHEKIEAIRQAADYIWHRGHGYVDEIFEYNIKGQKVIAGITGTYDYKTFIDFGNFDYGCSCPADKPCKHICALAMAVERGIIEIEGADYEVPQNLRLGLDLVRPDSFEIIALDDQSIIYSIYKERHTNCLTDENQKLYQSFKKFKRHYTHLNLPFIHIDDYIKMAEEYNLSLELFSSGRIYKFAGYIDSSLRIFRGGINYDRVREARYNDAGRPQYLPTETEEEFIPDARHYDYHCEKSFEVKNAEGKAIRHSLINHFDNHSGMLFLSSRQFAKDYGSVTAVKAVSARKNGQPCYYLIRPVRPMISGTLSFDNVVSDWAEYEEFADPEVVTAVKSTTMAGPIWVIDLQANVTINDNKEQLSLVGKVSFGYSRTAEDIAGHLKKDSKESSLAPLLCVSCGRMGARAYENRNFVVKDPGTGLLAGRDLRAEEHLAEKAKIPFSFKKSTGEFTVKPRAIKKFLTQKLSQVIEHPQVLLRTPPELIALLKQRMVQAQIVILSASNINWFDGKITFANMSAEDTARILTAYKEKQDFTRLSDQTWFALDQADLKELLRDIETQGLKVKKDGTISEISWGDLVALDKKKLKLKEENDAERRRNRQLLKLKTSLARRQPAGAASLKLDQNFKGKLRSYQQEGLKFFHFLYHNYLGGILADEMGLGKTVQAIAFMHWLAGKKKNSRFLVVCPLSAINVWAGEIQKFSPGLTTLLWHGPGRKQEEGTLRKAKVVITTYHTMTSDQKMLAQHDFNAAFIDEAQQIKNYRSRAAKAIRKLKVGSYFCLSGTPLENHLAELWAHFDLVFPGLLGRRKAFLSAYNSGPGGESANLGSLRQRIRPFLLRRVKKDVVKELPAKTEKIVTLPMSKEQAVIYEKKRQEAVKELQETSAGYLFRLLSHLTSLRRLSCHAMLKEKTTDPYLEYSGKLQYLDEMLEELNQRQGVIIFSQYTDFLARVKNLFDKRQIDYYYLDGKTPQKTRKQMVEAFQGSQNEDVASPKFFLISLKAGGFALTLHRADTVIHLDPWYNPAVEDQATDRVHRIGQKKNVLVYKLVSEGTVEEKVNTLKERKKKLFEQMFASGFENTKSFSDEELRGLLE